MLNGQGCPDWPFLRGPRHLGQGPRPPGGQKASGDAVALTDADVVLPPGSLKHLLAESGPGGLQLGLANESDGPGYRALAWHRNHSQVQSGAGACATLMCRDVLLPVGFSNNVRTGEDIE